jgi:hypothetical protein
MNLVQYVLCNKHLKIDILIKTNLEGEAHLVILKIPDDGVRHLGTLGPSSGVLKNVTFQELDLFQSLGEGWATFCWVH